MTSHPILSLNHISKSFTDGSKKIPILKDINLEVFSGETVGIVGASGCGKSTLLHIAGLLDTPSSGSMKIKEQSLETANDKTRTRFRRHEIGFIFQQHHLLRDFTSLENIAISERIAGQNAKQAEKNAKRFLKKFNLEDRGPFNVQKLSGGEQQRVSIARAFSRDPSLILADEPTGNLDAVTSRNVMTFFFKKVKEQDVAALIVTHDMELAKQFDRVLVLREGILSPLQKGTND